MMKQTSMASFSCETVNGLWLNSTTFPKCLLWSTSSRIAIQAYFQVFARERCSENIFKNYINFKNRAGDLKNSEAMLDWLSSIKSLDMPDKIEQISSSSLSGVIDEYDFVAVFFCKRSGNWKCFPNFISFGFCSLQHRRRKL